MCTAIARQGDRCRKTCEQEDISSGNVIPHHCKKLSNGNPSYILTDECDARMGILSKDKKVKRTFSSLASTFKVI